MITLNPLNLKKLKKDQILWLFSNNCKKHRVKYIQHPGCYLSEKPADGPIIEKVGFFDIETSGLAADFAFIFSYALRGDDNKLYGRTLTPNEIRHGVFDKYLVREMCRDLKRFNRIVVHYGIDRKFDCPFARTRAIKHGADFPLYKDICVSDTWLMAKNKLKLRSNRLGVICEFFGITAKEHPLTPDIWQTASAGKKQSLEYIWVHNKEDVDSMRKVYNLLKNYSPERKTSI